MAVSKKSTRRSREAKLARAVLRTAENVGYDRPTIAKELGIAMKQLDNAIDRHVREEWRAGRAASEVKAQQRRLDEIKQLREKRDLLKEIAGENNIREYLTTLTESVAARFDAPPKFDLPKLRAGMSEETILLKFSDWHAYERILAERTRGFNHYDGPEFGARVQHVVDSAISIKRKMERGGGWRFPKLVVGANGDFVSGTIHELERHTDAPSIVQAVYGCAELLARAIRDLSAEFPAVEVFCTAGNHGRLPDARRMQQKDPTRSWDTMVYLIARSMLRDVEHVEFFIPNSYSVAFEIEGWNFLQTHGHDVKSWNSIPWYGLNRLVSNINALEASRGKTIHYFLFGHFHEKSSLEHASGESFINPSLIGGNEFTLNALGKMGKPGQLMLGVHQEHGVTWRFPLSAVGEMRGDLRYNVRPWEAAA